MLIQNILPLVKKGIRNSILKVLINRSMNLSNFILIQLNHLKEDIDKKFHSKIIQIGETTSSEVEYQIKVKHSFFGSDVANKNYNFMKNVLSQLPNKKRLQL